MCRNCCNVFSCWELRLVNIFLLETRILVPQSVQSIVSGLIRANSCISHFKAWAVCALFKATPSSNKVVMSTFAFHFFFSFFFLPHGISLFSPLMFTSQQFWPLLAFDLPFLPFYLLSFFLSLPVDFANARQDYCFRCESFDLWAVRKKSACHSGASFIASARASLRTSTRRPFFVVILCLVGWLFGFHGISTTMGYSMPNPVYIYEFYMICNHFFYI